MFYGDFLQTTGSVSDHADCHGNTPWPSVGLLLHREHKFANEQTEVAIRPRKCCHPSSVGSLAGGVDD